MKKRRTLILFLAASFFSLQAFTAGAAFFINGSFEDGAFAPDGFGFMSLPSGSPAIAGWTTFSNELVWVGTPNVSAWPASDGNRFLDLTGYHDSVPYGGIQQSFSTALGLPYHVTFDLSVNQSSPVSNGPITVRVAATGNAPQDFTYNPPGGGIQWGGFSYDFTATGPSTDLSFLGTFAAGGRTINLDNVQVSTVPEPTSAFVVTILMISAIKARRGFTALQIVARQPERVC